MENLLLAIFLELLLDVASVSPRIFIFCDKFREKEKRRDWIELLAIWNANEPQRYIDSRPQFQTISIIIVPIHFANLSRICHVFPRNSLISRITSSTPSIWSLFNKTHEEHTHVCTKPDLTHSPSPENYTRSHALR